MVEKSVFEMSDAEIVAGFEPIFEAILKATSYRALGLAYIHLNIQKVRHIAEVLSRSGKLKGTIEDIPLGERGFLWKDVELTPVVKINSKFRGALMGVNTVVSKPEWWKLDFLDRTEIAAYDLKTYGFNIFNIFRRQ